MMRLMPEIEGPVYLRLNRNDLPVVTDVDGAYEFGKAQLIRDGGDAAIFATGVMVARALEAAEALSAEGIALRVVNVSTIKPLDREGVRKYASDVKAVMTAEEHSVIGGLGSAICEALSEARVPVRIMGIQDAFGRSAAAYDELMATLGKVIHQNIYQDFKDAFSLEHLQELVQKRVRDFGGDFLRRFNGQYRWVNVRALFDESLSVGEVVLCFREVDEEKQAELRQMEFLENTLQTMKESEASKDRFFSNMSHDMRTPLNAILGLSRLAREQVNDPVRTADYLEKINHSSQQLLELINDILELSKIEQGKLSLSESQFDLRRYVEDCCSAFQFQAERENKGFELGFRLQDQQVVGDAQRLGQVMNNLLSNAVKFTEPGGDIRVDVVQMEPGPHAKYQFTVSDSGVGMSKEFLEKLFIPYERDTQFGAKNVSGTGLGMPIAKSIVQHMGGRITVESSLGKGTTFTVTLPFQTPRDEDAPEPDEKAAQPAEEYQLEEKLVLVAEDNELNMEITTEILKSQGAQVLQAWNGREALEVFRASEPFAIDAILMDMQMPEMNGCEAAKAIRALDRPDAQQVPIIAVTANAFAEDIAATAAAGMNAHVSKPIDFEVLKKTLRDLAGS